MKTLLFLTLTIALGTLTPTAQAASRPLAGNLTSQKYAVRASATVSEKPLQITLNWTAEKCFSYIIYRRFLGDTEWPPFPSAVLDGEATSFVDKKIKVGVTYEYRIDRQGKNYLGRGYLLAGIKIPLIENRGKVILIVEKSVAADLATELTRLERDLVGDGWQVLRHDVARDEKVTAVKKIIVAEYKKDPSQVNTVFLFGNVPIPYSGNIFPDGHPNHRGAWPADLYYGDIDGIWTDKKKYKLTPRKSENNEPGDGKFDQSTVPPNSIELAVGRVDLSDMPAFPESETELLRRYLNKDHFFRHGNITAPARGLVDDNFGSFRGEAFGSSAWRNFAAFFTDKKVQANDFISTLATDKYLWAYGNGGGSPHSAGGIGTTEDFVKHPPKAIFTLLFGSYFGDWNWQNNFLRAPLAAAGYSLTCAWDGRPHWYLHHMALGQTIGYSTLRSQNNYPPLDYLICNDAKSYESGKDDDSEWSFNPVHVALMGDPTLRMFPGTPPRDIQIRREKDAVVLSWIPQLGIEVVGYQVYAADSLAGPFKLLTKKPLQWNEYHIKTSAGKATKFYQVKTLVLQESGSGTFYNASQAAYARLTAGQAEYSAPKLTRRSQKTREDTPVTSALPTHQSSQPIQLWSTPTPPTHGRLKLDGKGNYTYTPAANYNGDDHFQFFVWDGLNDSNPSISRVMIESVPDAPRAVSKKVCLVDTKPLPIELQASDADDPKQKIIYVITQQPTQGKLTGNAPKLTYHPQTMLTHPDTVVYTASDGKLISPPATITIMPPQFCPPSSRKKVIDGKFNDWAALPIVNHAPEQFKITSKKVWQGEKDNLFSIGTVYDKDFLYIAVKTVDEQYQAVKDKAPWTQDGIEVRLHAGPKARRAASRGKKEMTDFLLFALSPSPTAAKSWLYKTKKKLPEGCKFVCVKTATGFNTEIAVPILYLNKMAGGKWSGFRLNVCVDDLDDDGLVQIWWKPDWRSAANYWGSGSFIRK